MSGSTLVNEGNHFYFKVLIALFAVQLGTLLHLGYVCYVIAVAVGAIYLVRVPSEALWVGVTLLSVTSIAFPTEIDEIGVAVRGGFRPYILVVATVTFAVTIGLWFRPRIPTKSPGANGTVIWGRTFALITVFFLALANGFFASISSPGIVDAVRESSGWMTLIVFLVLGYWLGWYRKDSHVEFTRLRAATIAYSVFFLLKFGCLSVLQGVDETAAVFGYSQREITYFSGLVLVIIVADALRQESKVNWKPLILPTIVLCIAVLLAGSRAEAACTFLTIVLLVMMRYPKQRRRFIVVGLTLAIVLIVVASELLSTSGDPSSGVARYVGGRFLTLSAEDTSLISRASEMVAVGDALRDHPFLGRGPLASYSFFDPIFGWKDTTYVDSGIGYLLMKTGFIGFFVFLWFAFGWLKMAKHVRALVPAVIVPSFATFLFFLIYLPFGPSFFQFEYSWFVGLLAGQTLFVASRASLHS